MAEKIYLDSTRVHIYPCANRGAGIDIESKLTTESNLINLPARLDPVSSTGLDFINHKLIFIIGGYYIEADLTGETDLQSNCWADYKLAIANLTMSKTGTETYVTKSNMLSNYETGSFELDTNDGKFKGIAFSTDTFGTDTCVQLLKDGELVEQGLFGNITRKGGIAGDAAVPDTGDYLVFLDSSNNNKITKLSPKLDKSQVKMFLSQDGTFRKATLDKFEVALNSSADVHFEDRGEVITGPLNLSLGESRILQCINNTENELKFSTTGGVATLISEVDDKTHNILAVLNAEQEGSISAIRKVYIKTTVTLLTDKFAGLTYYSDKACTTPITSPINIEGYAGEKTKTVYIKSDKFTTIPKSEITVGSIGCKIAKVSGTTGIFSCKFSLLETTTTACTLNIFYDNYDIDFVAANTNGVKWYSDSALTKELITLSVARDSMKSSAYNYSDAYCKVDGSSKPEDISLTLSGSVIDKLALAEGNNYKQYKLTIGGKGKIGNGSVTASADKRYKIELSGIISGSSSSSIFWTETETGTQHITEYYTKKDEEKIVYLHINNPPSSEYYNHSIIHSSQGDGIEVDSEEISSTSNIIYRVTITAKETISANDKLTSTVTFTEKYKTVSIYTLAYPTQAASSPSANKSTGRAGKDSVSVEQGIAATGWKWKQWSRQIDTNNWAEGYKTTESITNEEIPSTATTKVTYRADYKVKVSTTCNSTQGTVTLTGECVEFESSSTTSGYVWSSANVRTSNFAFTAKQNPGYKFIKWIDSSGATISTSIVYQYTTDRVINGPITYTAVFEEISEYTVTLEENNRYYWSKDPTGGTGEREYSIKLKAGETTTIYAVAKNGFSESLYIEHPSTVDVTYAREPEVTYTEITISNCTANCTLKPYNSGDTEIELTKDTTKYNWIFTDINVTATRIYWQPGDMSYAARISKNTATDLDHALLTPSSIDLTYTTARNTSDYIHVKITNVSEEDTNRINLTDGKLIKLKTNDNIKWYDANDNTKAISSVVTNPNGKALVYIKNLTSSRTLVDVWPCSNPITACTTVTRDPLASASLLDITGIGGGAVSADCELTPYDQKYTLTLRENSNYYWTSDMTTKITSWKISPTETVGLFGNSKDVTHDMSRISAIVVSGLTCTANCEYLTSEKVTVEISNVKGNTTLELVDGYKVMLEVDKEMENDWVWKDYSKTKEINYIIVNDTIEQEVWLCATESSLEGVDLEQIPDNSLSIDFKTITEGEINMGLTSLHSTDATLKAFIS